MIYTSKLASFGIGTVAFAVAFAVHATEPAHHTEVRAERRLDLKAPSISKIFTPQQIDMILARAVDPELEHVEVEATRLGDLPLRDNSASVSEVAFKEVVRWLAPYPTVLAAQVSATPDVTNSYRPVPVSMSSYHASFAAPYNQR